MCRISSGVGFSDAGNACQTERAGTEGESGRDAKTDVYRRSLACRCGEYDAREQMFTPLSVCLQDMV